MSGLSGISRCNPANTHAAIPSGGLIPKHALQLQASIKAPPIDQGSANRGAETLANISIISIIPLTRGLW